MSLPDRTKVTYRRELRRAVANGILESAAGLFLLLIAVRWFHAGPVAKALVAGSAYAGLLLSPLSVSFVSRRGWPAARAAGALALLGGAAFFCMAALPWLPVYVAGAFVANACVSTAVPLVTQIYQENYPPERRGRLYSTTVIVRIAAVAVFSELAGHWLKHDLSKYYALLLTFGCAFLYSARCLWGIPSNPLHQDARPAPRRAWGYLREDRLFRRTLISWMIMGFANLMMLPLRIDYLANPRYALGLDEQTVALIAGVVPSLVRLSASRGWGWLFDHINFFALRISINLCFAAAILTFFLSASLPGLLAGAALFGLASSGGDVAWGLWVTKFSPPERTADYMSVHTFLTGTRGLLAPQAGFQLAQILPLPELALCAVTMILIASSILLPLTRTEPRYGGRPGLPHPFQGSND